MSYYFLFWEGEELDKGKAEYIPIELLSVRRNSCKECGVFLFDKVLLSLTIFYK